MIIDRPKPSTNPTNFEGLLLAAWCVEYALRQIPTWTRQTTTWMWRRCMPWWTREYEAELAACDDAYETHLWRAFGERLAETSSRMAAAATSLQDAFCCGRRHQAARGSKRDCSRPYDLWRHEVSTVSKGKKWERKLVHRLADVGWRGERVRGSGGGTGTIACDVVSVPESAASEITDGRIVKAVENGHIARQRLLRWECKYTASGKGHGYKSLCDTHLRTTGLGTVMPLRWPCGLLSGGFQAWAASIEYGDGVECYDTEDTLTKATRSLLDDTAGQVALRASRSPWVVVWEP